PDPTSTSISPLSLHDALPILTMTPQSTAHTTFSTLTCPDCGSTRAWMADAVHVGSFFSCAVTQAMPSPVFGGSGLPQPARSATIDRKSTRLNSSHQIISYAVF